MLDDVDGRPNGVIVREMTESLVSGLYEEKLRVFRFPEKNFTSQRQRSGFLQFDKKTSFDFGFGIIIIILSITIFTTVVNIVDTSNLAIFWWEISSLLIEEDWCAVIRQT